jgi:hypothetical protein
VEALRDRNFRLLFAARGISYVGTYLAPIAVASTLAVVRVRSVREVTAEPVVEAAPVAASA